MEREVHEVSEVNIPLLRKAVEWAEAEAVRRIAEEIVGERL